jgi:hypothetical protein
MIRQATSTNVRAESGLGRAARCTRVRRFCIAQASPTAMCWPRQTSRTGVRSIVPTGFYRKNFNVGFRKLTPRRRSWLARNHLLTRLRRSNDRSRTDHRWNKPSGVWPNTPNRGAGPGRSSRSASSCARSKDLALAQERAGWNCRPPARRISRSRRHFVVRSKLSDVSALFSTIFWHDTFSKSPPRISETGQKRNATQFTSS